MGAGSEVDKLLPLFFTASIYLWALFTSYSASGPLKSLPLHPHFVPPYLLTPSPSVPKLCLQLFSLVSSHMSIPALPFCFPHLTWRLFDISVGKYLRGSALSCESTMHRVAEQGTSAKGLSQAAPGALGSGLTALEIQKLILGETKVPHEGNQCLHSTRWL